MDAKDLRTETALSERSNNGNTNNYAHNSISFQCTDKNKSYHDIGSNSLPKVDVQTTRPCAVIGPDRILPQPLSVNNPYMKRGYAEPWQFPRPPEYPQKMTEYQHLTRNISPRQTFQENMQRIMVPPRPLTLEDTSFGSDKSDSLTKNISKLSMPSEGKYCDVPYTVSPLTNEKSAKSAVSNMNPSLMRSVWPPSGMNVRPPRPYGAPELYQYPDYSNCAAPHTLPVNRALQPVPEEPVHIYPDPYRGGNIRYEPYPSVKDRNPRYEYINYSNPYPPPHFPTHKYDVQKLGAGATAPPQSYASYPQVPLKYMREPHGYQRSPNPQPNYNVPFHNQGVYSNYGSIPGNCLPNKLYGYPTEGNYNPSITPKPPYDNNKPFVKYDNIQMRHYHTPENLYLNELSRSHYMKTSLGVPSSMNMHTLQTYPNYRKDNMPNMPMRHYDLSGQFKNIDPTYNTQMPRIASQFSPVESLGSENHNFGISPEDCGYVSQSSSNSVRSTDSGIHMYQRYGHMNRGSPIIPRNEGEPGNKNKKGIDVRQFLQMWNEGDEESGENNTNKNIVQTNSNDTKQSELYVLGLVNVPSEELDKYEHIQKVSKLPDNIKGYTSIDLLNQFEEVIESSNMNNYSVRTSNLQDIQRQNSPSVHIMKGANVPIRPLSPLDVESKISQSVIHKDVGCNFEIKPCSPKMLSVEVAGPVQTLMEERAIEKVTNQHVVKPSILPDIEENINNCHVIKRQDRQRPQNKEDSASVSSCKMAKTQYSVDITRATEKSNYSIQDFESNSGVCLASLPRLDNDIELSFPEVNQQFINANKGDTEVIANNSLKIRAFNETNPENNSTESKTRIKSPVSHFDSELPKLSKYRKNKNIKEQSDHSPFLSVQATRTDSVIIKNPENSGNFSEDISESISLKHTEISFNDKILSPINLAVNDASSCAKNNLNDLSNFVKEHVNTYKSKDLSDKAINLSLNSVNQHIPNNFVNKDQEFKIDLSNSNEISTESSIKSSPKLTVPNIPNIIITHDKCDQSGEEKKPFTEFECLKANKEDKKENTSIKITKSEHIQDDGDSDTVMDLNSEHEEHQLNASENVEIDEKSSNYEDTNKEKLYQLLEERVNDLPENLLTPLSDSTINDVSQDSLINDNDLDNNFRESKNEENNCEFPASLEKRNDSQSTLLSEELPSSENSNITSLQTQLEAVLNERKNLVKSESVTTKNYFNYQSTEHLLSEESVHKNNEIEHDSLSEQFLNSYKKTELAEDFIKKAKDIISISNQETSDESETDDIKDEKNVVKKNKPNKSANNDYVSSKQLFKDISINEIGKEVITIVGNEVCENDSANETEEVKAIEGEQKTDHDKIPLQDFSTNKDGVESAQLKYKNRNNINFSNEELDHESTIVENIDEISSDDIKENLCKEDNIIFVESKHELKENCKTSNLDHEIDTNMIENLFKNGNDKRPLTSPKSSPKRIDSTKEIDNAQITTVKHETPCLTNPDFSIKFENLKKYKLPFHKELYSSEVRNLLILQEGHISKYIAEQFNYTKNTIKIVKDFTEEDFGVDKTKPMFENFVSPGNEKNTFSKVTTEVENENIALHNDESKNTNPDNTLGFIGSVDENEVHNLKLELGSKSSDGITSLQDGCKVDKGKEIIKKICDNNLAVDNMTHENLAINFSNSQETKTESANSCEKCNLFDEKSNKLIPISRRRTHKRALSDSVMDIARSNNVKDNSKDDEFCHSNKSSLWPNKRKRTDFNLYDDSNSACSVQNRRNSISSVYHDENIAFCILIDNNCLISQEEYAEGTVCFADIQEEEFSTMVDNNFVSGDVESQPATPLPPDDEYSQSSKPDSLPIECITLKDSEVNWVDDVACVETVVSDDVFDDDDDVFVENVASSPQYEDIFDHTNKIKNIYGDEMCSDDIHLIKTLYSTPQMDMNKTLQDKESLILDNTKQYENECLESILSDNYVDEPKNKESNYAKDVCALNNDVNNSEEHIFQENYESVNLVNNEELNKRDKCLEDNLEGLERELSELPGVFTTADDDAINSCESTSELCHLNQSVNRLKYKRSSSSPEVTSTTEEKKSGILLKIINYNGSRMSHIDNGDLDNSKRIRCKFTEDNDYSNIKTDSIPPRPLLTKAAQKYIPPLKETIRDLKVKLFLPQTSLVKLKQLKVCKEEPKTSSNTHKHLKYGRPNFTKNTEKPKKPKPKFEDVLKSIDDIQIKMHKDKKKVKSSIPKVIIKKTENGSHYASTSNRDTFNPDLTGRKWQPWVFLEKSKFIDKMASRGQTKAIYCHRKKCYILAERFQKYRSISSQKFVISQPKLDIGSPGPLKYTIKLKSSY